MALTISPPSPAASSASDGSSNSISTGPPRTPVLTDLPLATPVVPSANVTSTINSASGGVKRTAKPNRRANTAERRATHNAVERQRRETLNGRFLDLAALLPNLSQIRRPSKSSIVNSSIAHINASRRHRLLAAQQLRLLKNETDALRHEVNEWRMRAGVPGVEEPRRPDGFGVILNGELEFEAGDMMEGDEGEEEDDFPPGSGGGVYDGRQYVGGRSYGEEPEEFIHLQQQQQQHQVDLMAPPFVAPEVTQPITIAIGAPQQQRQSHSPPQYASPMIASPTASAFDAAMVYDQHARQLHHHQLMLQQHHQQEDDKWAYQQQMRARQATW
ncbi:hypothetical protein FB451DRAFT_1236780 [Mycena latifolia]|nr:hypothetical protein FB451DRAFT_1236780 [Mycena latifolia]